MQKLGNNPKKNYQQVRTEPPLNSFVINLREQVRLKNGEFACEIVFEPFRYSYYFVLRGTTVSRRKYRILKSKAFNLELVQLPRKKSEPIYARVN